jgi:hypothetical protein
MGVLCVLESIDIILFLVRFLYYTVFLNFNNNNCSHLFVFFKLNYVSVILVCCYLSKRCLYAFTVIKCMLCQRAVVSITSHAPVPLLSHHVCFIVKHFLLHLTFWVFTIWKSSVTHWCWPVLIIIVCVYFISVNKGKLLKKYPTWKEI